MKNLLKFLLTVLFCLESFHLLKADNVFHPISDFHVVKTSYCLSYDARNKNPAWTYECLTFNHLCGKANRSLCKFREDETFPEFLRATLLDYKNSGYDRGHLVPAANYKYCDAAMHDTFLLTNICPQHPCLNRGYWAHLENIVRDLTKIYPKVHVISGPLYLPYTDKDGKRYVKYEVIGPNDIAVPTHFFKVIATENGNGKIDAQAYIFPNTKILESSLESFKSTIRKVEQCAGIIFPFGNQDTF